MPGKYHFSPGLYLQVTGLKAKSWIYRFSVRRQERFMGLGSARDVTFAQARKRVDELRVNQGSKKIDPIAERKARARSLAPPKRRPYRSASAPNNTSPRTKENGATRSTGRNGAPPCKPTLTRSSASYR